MYQETYLEIAIKCFLAYPVWCIGATAILYFVLKVYTDKTGKTKIREIGDNLTKREASQVAASSSNTYELKNRYWQSGDSQNENTEENYQQFGGETPNGGMISWLIQPFKSNKK